MHATIVLLEIIRAPLLDFTWGTRCLVRQSVTAPLAVWLASLCMWRHDGTIRRCWPNCQNERGRRRNKEHEKPAYHSSARPHDMRQPEAPLNNAPCRRCCRLFRAVLREPLQMHFCWLSTVTVRRLFNKIKIVN